MKERGGEDRDRTEEYRQKRDIDRKKDMLIHNPSSCPFGELKTKSLAS